MMILDHLNPRHIKAEEEDKTEVIVKGVIRIGTDEIKAQIVGIKGSLGKMGIDWDLSQVTEGTIFEIVLEDTVDKIAKGSIEIIIIGIVVTIEAGIGPDRDHSQKTISVIELEVQVIVDWGQHPEPVLIEIG